MNIVITGHTSGVGKAVYNKLNTTEHTVIGLSRSNGYNLSSDTIDKFVNAIKDADVFINNAYEKWTASQVELLFKVYEEWKDEDKTIISTGSVVGDYYSNDINYYRNHKVALDDASEHLSSLGNKCRVSIVRPGWINTNFNDKTPDNINALTADQVADAIIYILSQPDNVCIKNLSIEPRY